MQLRRLVYPIICLLATTLLAGGAVAADMPVAAESPAETQTMTPAAATPLVYRFHPGDQLAISAINRPELTITARVDPYGYIAYPYLGQVNIKNLSPQEVAETLARGLKEGGYFNRPVLNVSLVAAGEQFVYILGEVKKPGPVPVSGKLSLLEAIGRAGGQTYDSEMSTVIWIRGNESPPGVVKLDLRSLGDPGASGPLIPSITLLPGDVIYVPDSVIASIERFFGRMYTILRPIVLLEQGISIYPSVEAAIHGKSGTNSTINIVVP